MAKSFFEQPTLKLAKSLLGKELRHATNTGITSGRIIEVEAYMGPEDRAAHSFGGRRTKRTEVMYGPPGRAYIFLIYGMHLCFNIVSGPINKPEAILVRAIEPTEGINLMSKRRYQKSVSELTSTKQIQLTNGPGKLTKALGITSECNGHDLTQAPLQIIDLENNVQDENIAMGPRINIDYAKEAIDYPWRFWIKDHPYVSI